MKKQAVGGLLLVAGLVFFAGSAHAWPKAEENVHDIGHRRVAHRSLISEQKEIAIGKQYAVQIEHSAKMFNDPVINEYVNRVEQNIARNSDVKIPVSVRIIDDPTVNAMTLPGGFIFVNTGLLKMVTTEDQLAGVLAHETGHVAARHWASQTTKREIAQYAMLPLIFVPMSAAVYYGVMEAYMNGVPLAFLKFSRHDEAEADFLGIQYMWKAGYDPNGMVEAFGRIIQESRRQPGSVPSIFMDHPPTGDRILNAEEEIKNLLPKRGEYLVTTSEFNDMKARLEEIMNLQKGVKGQGGPTLRRRESASTPTSNGQGDKPPVLRRRN